MEQERPFSFLPHQLLILSRARLIYLTTVRKGGDQSRPAPVWFTITPDQEILIQTAPDTWHARRIRRGSPVIVSVGGRNGLAFVGCAKFSQDSKIIDQIVNDFPRKYLMAWLGLYRPTKASFLKGTRAAIRITPIQILPPEFVARPGAPAPI